MLDGAPLVNRRKQHCSHSADVATAFAVKFFNDVETVECERDGVTKLKAVCKKCKMNITANWKPVRVTSNLISHLKVNVGVVKCLIEFSSICNLFKHHA